MKEIWILLYCNVLYYGGILLMQNDDPGNYINMDYEAGFGTFAISEKEL